MWNTFLEGFDAVDLYIDPQAHHIDYNDMQEDYQTDIDDDTDAPDVIDYVINYDEESGQGVLEEVENDDEPPVPEVVDPFRNDWIEPVCDLPQCTVCNEEWDLCDPYVVCEGKKFYVPFCEPPSKYECD